MSDLKSIPKQSASPVAAVTLALATISCCVPFGFLGALGLAGAAAALQVYRPWLMAGAVLFLGLGFYRLYGRNQRLCRTKSSVIVFWVSVGIVLLIFIFPQVIASLLAGLN